jgi:type I restriction enzyme S subunit
MSMPRYPAYKETGIDWLGTVPEHWRVERFKLSVESCMNGVWGEEASNKSNDVVCIRVADFDRQKLIAADPEEPTIRNISDRDIEARSLRCGDLLIEKSGGGEKQPVGAVVLFTGSTLAVCSNFVARMRLAPGMTPSFWRYAHHAAHSLRVNTKSIKQTSGIQNLDQQQYLDELAAYPPSDEQEEIANFLDRETAKIDALIAEQQRLIELLQEKRQAVISHAVTKGLNPNAPMKDSGVEWLGEVPEHWEVKNIRMAAERITYGFTNPMPTEERGPYMLTANDIDNGRIRFESCRRTSEYAFLRELTDKSRPIHDDILLTKDGTLGRVALYTEQDEPACINQSVALLRPNKSLCLGGFLATALISACYQERMLFDAGGTTIKHIYISRLAKMAIALPPISEQEEMLVKLEKRTRPYELLIADSNASLALLQERRSSLISAAVTGQIDVRGLVPEAGK